jgi:hypothetical protein
LWFYLEDSTRRQLDRRLKLKFLGGKVTTNAGLLACSAKLDGSTYWLVWCHHCQRWHRHGPAEGHRQCHRNTPARCVASFPGGSDGAIWHTNQRG